MERTDENHGREDFPPVMSSDQMREARDLAAELYWRMEGHYPDEIVKPIRHFVYAMTLAIGDDQGYEETLNFVMDHYEFFSDREIWAEDNSATPYSQDPIHPYQDLMESEVKKPYIPDDDEIPF